MDERHYRSEFEDDRKAVEIEMPNSVLRRLTTFVCEKASEWFSSEEGKAALKRNRDNARRRAKYAENKKGGLG